MKKTLLLLSLICSMLFIAACGKQDTALKEVHLNEVAHSIFYAPMYVAIENGYFEEEGLKIDLVNGSGADNVMTSLLSGDSDIGLMGPEATVYVYNQQAETYAINFAQLTQRAGNFLVSREDEKNFSWEKLKNKTVLAGRAGGMPQMVFEYILKKNLIDPSTDLTMIQNIDFGLTAEAFASGTADYTVEFEPFASSLETNGNGCVVASLGEESGYVPYTCFSTLQATMDKDPAMIQSFTNAIQKGLNYVNNHTPAETAKIIQPQFSETSVDAITKIVDRYGATDTWKTNCVLTDEAFTLLQDILDEAGELNSRVPYDTLVDTTFAEKAQ